MSHSVRVFALPHRELLSVCVCCFCWCILLSPFCVCVLGLLTCVTEQYIGFQISRASARYFALWSRFITSPCARLPACLPHAHAVNFCHLFISTQLSVRAPGFFFDRKLTVRRLNGVTEQKVSWAELIKGNKEQKSKEETGAEEERTDY